MRDSTLAALLASILLLSVPAGVVGAAAPAAAGAGSGPAATDAPAERGDGPAATGTVAPALRQGNGTTQVVVRLEGVQLPNDRASQRASDRAQQALASEARRSQGQVVQFAKRTDGVEVAQRLWLANAVLLEVDRDRVALDSIAALDGVERLHPNFAVQAPEPSEAAGVATVQDGDDGYETTYGLDQINATQVWDEYGTRGGGVKVAVLDTGVDPDHPDVDLYTEDPDNESYPGGWAEFTESGERVAGSTPHDTAEHGTHTSGTVAGGNASGEYVGVAPAADLMHGLVLPDGEGTFTQIIAGMQWAVEADADVVSMSLGADGYFDEMVEPVRNAQAAGTVVVASSGNTGDGVSGTPGNVYESVAVGATDVNRAVAYFSNGETVDTDEDWGEAAPEDWPAEYVVPDVTAPGVAVRSAEPGGGYQHLSGTSMAAPHVAGSVALLLGAAGGNASVADLKTALYRTATKPADCQPGCSPRDGNDTRYGAGVVDVAAAAALVAADAGVAGTVTDEDGDPVADATVVLDGGVSTTTDDDGEYSLLATPGEHTVTVAGPFGFGDAGTTVTVTNGSEATANFTLPDEVDAAVADGQSGGVQAGDAASATLSVANLDGYTVELSGDYDAADATLTVNGVEREFGEAVGFDDYTGELTVTVETAADATGSFSLHHEFDGPGGSASLDTGPTAVYADEVRVGVVDSTDGVRYGPDVAAALESTLPVAYSVSVVNGTAAAVEAVDEYDAFVVQNVSAGPEGMRAFADATASGDVGVVYLNQYGPVSNGVSALSAATGEPGTTSQQARFYNYNEVFYEATADHPITDGVADPGELAVLQPIGYMDWFGRFDGSALAKAGYETCGFFGCSNVTIEESTGLAVDGAARTVLAASLGRVPPVRNDQYTDAADELLGNAVRWASDAPPATVADGQPRTASPGEAVSTTVAATNLTSLTVSVDEEFSTIAPANVTLSVDGEQVALGEPVAFDGLTTDGLAVEVQPDAGVTGAVSLDYAFEADGETVTGSTGPTTVYEPPLTVPGDAATLQEAVDVAPHGATIEVGDGEYGPVNVRDAGNHDLTIRGAPDADPTVSAPAERGQESYALAVRADGVTVEDLDVTVPNEFDHGVSVYDASDVTVADVTVTGGEYGVAVGAGDATAPGTDVRNVSVTGAQVGVHVSRSSGSSVTNATVADAARAGVRLSFANDSTVRNNAITGGPVGVEFEYWNYDATVANNTVADVETGVHVTATSSGKRVVGNDVTATRTGVRVEGRTDIGPAETDLLRNRIDAPTGVDVATAPDAVRLRYNHLRDTDVAVRTKGREPVDARLNYLGDRGPVGTTLEGPVSYDPFLTAPPAAVEAGNATAIATDLELPAGEATALGIPGPTNRSIHEILGDDFDGDVYRYNRNAGKWQPVTGQGRLAAVEALDAFKVVPESDARAVVSFRTAGDRGPPGDHPGEGTAKGNGKQKGKDGGKQKGNGKRKGNGQAGGAGAGPPPKSPGEATLKPGWNFVAAPAYGPVEAAFANATATVTEVKPVGDGPDGQLGPAGDLNGSHEFGAGAGPNASAFAGYLVHVEDRGTLPAALSANPTAAALYDALSLSADLADADPAAAGNATATVERTVTVGDDEWVLVATVGEPYGAVLQAPDDEDADDESASRRGGAAVAAAP